MSLGLSKRRAAALLSAAVDRLLPLQDGYDIAFDKSIPPGFGFCSESKRLLSIGVGGLFPGFLDSHAMVEDLSFTSAIVALYHEHSHYLDRFMDDTPKYVILSNVGAMHNRSYYLNGWREMPHEISAEWSGVISAYTFMRAAFGDVGESCIIDYVRDKIENTSYFFRLSGCV